MYIYKTYAVIVGGKVLTRERYLDVILEEVAALLEKARNEH